ncbi:hypothetical protein [Streptomyces sp. C1-2]|uniref:hypothetical protein n=1 Tax=Streptomyces sp. C1-2 TaxID=2720022 RepID=UPI001432651F|nr:hypothetical protein [Streptomyces sp. C1-2]NJP71920.1 hypothetical protein [Streptomyces sp. C1-2]
MTALRICIEVSCDGPDDHTECPDSAAVRRSVDSVTAPQVRADGRTQGWTTRRRNGRLRDLCPTCRDPQPPA